MYVKEAIAALAIWETQSLGWRWILISVSLTVLLFGMYQLATVAALTVVLRKQSLREPPVLPYSVQLVGHTLYFMWDVFALFTSIT